MPPSNLMQYLRRTVYGASTRAISNATQRPMGLCSASPLSGCRYATGLKAAAAKAAGQGNGDRLLLSRHMSSNSSGSDQVKEIN